MNDLNPLPWIAEVSRRARAPILAFALLLLPGLAAADDGSGNRTGWVANLTPVLILASGDYRFGGGADPEVRYCFDLGGARVGAWACTTRGTCSA